MSISELAITEGSLAVAFLLGMGAVAIGMIPVDEKRRRLARNCLLASCTIFVGIAIMWGVMTTFSPVPRIIIVGVLTGLAGIAAVESTRFVMQEQHEPEKPKSQASSELSNAELKKAVFAFAAKMRDFEMNADRTMTDIAFPMNFQNLTEEQKSRIWKERNERIQESVRQKQAAFSNNYLGSTREYHDEITKRLRAAGILPPYLDEQTPSLQIARSVFRTGQLAGPHPVGSLADYLERLVRLLPNQ